MKREQIEKAAKEAVQDHFQCNGKYPCEERDYCEFCNGHNSAFDCKEDCGADDFNEGFIAGAQWRINAVWHDAHEEPQRSGMLIASNEDGNYILCGPNNSNWKQTVKLFRIMNWAYIIDLLPERKEETE